MVVISVTVDLVVSTVVGAPDSVKDLVVLLSSGVDGVFPSLGVNVEDAEEEEMVLGVEAALDEVNKIVVA